MSLDPLISLLVAVIVLLIGTVINRRSAAFEYNIPDPITGGLLFAAAASVAWSLTDFRFRVRSNDQTGLLLMFFAGVGMCADLSSSGRVAKRS